MTYLRRAYYIGVLAYSIGWFALLIPHARTVSSVAGHIGVLILLGTFVTWLIARLAKRDHFRSTATIRIIAIAVFTELVPYAVTALASSGGTLKCLFHSSAYGWQGWLARLLGSNATLLLYCILIELPYYLHRYAPPEKVTNKTRILVPAWGSAGAAVATGLLILILHFGSGPLADVSILTVIISGVAVTTLLLPFFGG